MITLQFFTTLIWHTNKEYSSIPPRSSPQVLRLELRLIELLGLLADHQEAWLQAATRILPLDHCQEHSLRSLQQQLMLNHLLV